MPTSAAAAVIGTGRGRTLTNPTPSFVGTGGRSAAGSSAIGSRRSSSSSDCEPSRQLKLQRSRHRRPRHRRSRHTATLVTAALAAAGHVKKRLQQATLRGRAPEGSPTRHRRTSGPDAHALRRRYATRACAPHLPARQGWHQRGEDQCGHSQLPPFPSRCPHPSTLQQSFQGDQGWTAREETSRERQRVPDHAFGAAQASRIIYLGITYHVPMYLSYLSTYLCTYVPITSYVPSMRALFTHAQHRDHRAAAER